MRNILLAGFVALAAAPLCAQEYPARTVRMIVTFPPGGGADLLARIVARQLTEKWGQTVQVDNRAGGDGANGAAVGAKAAPDGYTVLMIISTHTVLPSLKNELNYDVVKDFQPVIRMAEAPNAVVVHPSFPARTVPDLIAIAKKNPGKLDYPGSGFGGPAHLAGVLFDRMAGTQMTFIPYKGAGPSLIALIGGQVHVMFPAITGSLPHVRAGKLRALGVTSEQRLAILPDVPPVGDTLKGYVFVGWYGLVVPAGTPSVIVDKIYTDTSATLGNPDIKTFLAGEGLAAAIGNPAQFTNYIAAELKKSARLVSAAGLQKN